MRSQHRRTGWTAAVAPIALVAVLAAAERSLAGPTIYRFTLIDSSDNPNLRNAAINDNGDVTYALDRRTVYVKAAGGAPRELTRQALEFSYPSINGAGEAAWTEQDPDSDVFTTTVYRTSGGGRRLRVAGLAETGMRALSSPTINRSGVVAFSGISGTADDPRRSVFAGTAPDNLRVIATSGERFAGFGTESLLAPRIDDAGDVLFQATGPFPGPDGSRSTTTGVYLDRAGKLITVVEYDTDFSQSAPGIGAIAISEGGTVGYTELGNGGNGEAVFTWRDGARRRVADTSGSFQSIFGVAVNDAGDVAFIGELDSTDPIDPEGPWGIYTGPDAGRDLVFAVGHELFDRGIEGVGLSAESINNRGQIVFTTASPSGSMVVLADPVTAAVPLPPALPAALVTAAALGGLGASLRATKRRQGDSGTRAGRTRVATF